MTTGAGGPPRLLLLGDPRHGVAIAAREIAAAAQRREPDVVVIEAHDPFGRLRGSRAHVHFTDRMWADSPEAAADRFEVLAADTATSVTLHDIPQSSDGPRNLLRRTDAYRRVVAAARAVAVNSHHEAALLAEAGIASGAVEVIPLAVDRSPGEVAVDQLDDSVAILGFFYPGKGHAEVVDALASLGAETSEAASPTTVTSIGGVSPGHESELDALRASASARGIAVSATGFLPHDELLARCRTAGVPVVAHRHFSASASLGTWIAAGRRPLVVDSRYAREMESLRPGTLTVVGTDDLAGAILRARLDPPSTLIAADIALAPGIADTAAAYLDWWQNGVSW